MLLYLYSFVDGLLFAGDTDDYGINCAVDTCRIDGIFNLCILPSKHLFPYWHVSQVVECYVISCHYLWNCIIS